MDESYEREKQILRKLERMMENPEKVEKKPSRFP
jgi:hypothetical protein